MDQTPASSIDRSTAPPLPATIAAEYSDRVNFGMQQNGVPVVREVAITNTGDAPMHDLTVTVSLDNGECEPWQRTIARIDAGATYRLEPDTLSLDPRESALRTEAQRTALRVEVACNGASHVQTFAIDLLAFDEWPGVGHWPEMTAAFVTPNHPRIAELLNTARTALGAISERDALDGYQSGSRQRAAHIAEACFNAVAAQHFGYINPPASFEQQGQRVRLVDRLCREKLATCLDLSLLLASMWEQCGLHPVVLLPEGHAMPAFWTHDAHLPEVAIDEPARIRNLIELGELVPVESTLLTQSGATFAEAVDAAKRRMNDPGATFCAIDIRTCRKRSIRPLPLRDEGDGSAVDLDQLVAPGVPAAASTTLDRLTLAERAEQQTAEDPRAEARGRIERWQTRLLDLSLRNRLLNFRETGRTLRFNVPDAAMVEDALAQGDTFSIQPRTDGDEAFLRAELEARRLFATETSAEVQKRLLTLYRTAKSSIEETGANLLHLAVGMLKWYESEVSQTPRYAPIILLPVELKRSSGGAGYRYDMLLSEEPLRPNVTLLEKLRTEFGIDTQPLHGMPEDENGLDVPLILRNFRAAIRDSRRWEVEETVQLGLFSFNKFLMWRDLRENLDKLKQNRLVAHLTEGAGADFDAEPFPQPEALDANVQPGELYCTRDADSSQLAAVQAVAAEKSFVLEGPPGTGKSQTIANVIADSLARGKRVLFVAEKMAALDVVRRRLEDDGLGPFTLELHSAKASKKEVLAQLEAALNAAAARPPANWAQLCTDLRITRDQLNTYVRELHAERPSGETLYRVLGRLSLLGEGPRIELPGNAGATTREQLEAWRSALATVHERSAGIDPPDGHPLRGIGRSDWQFDLPAQVRQAIDDAETAINALGEAARAFAEAAQIDLSVDALSRAGVQGTAIVAHQMRQLTAPLPDAALLLGNTATLHQQIREIVQRGRRRDEQRATLCKRYREEFLDLEHLVHIDALARVQKQPAVLRVFTGFFARRKLRPYVLNELPSIETLHADLESARSLKRETAALANQPDIARALGSLWNNGQTDWQAIEQMLDQCAKLRGAIDALQQDRAASDVLPRLAAAAVNASRLRAAQSATAPLIAAWNTWSQAWETLKRVLHTSGDEAFGGKRDAWLATARQTFERWRSGLGELDQWCAWRQARDAAAALGLTDLLARYERGELKRDELTDVFERSFGEKWFNATANRIEPIRTFNFDSHQAAIEKFRRIDRELIAQTRHVIAARLAHTTPPTDAPVSGQSELGILRREIQKKRRHLPTRRLIESIPNLLARLKPCFLMSPLSVAQYLDASLPPFDLVVFDEASQIPVWDAIGAIARGTNVVVVGDSKQLPPTTFFDIVSDEEVGAEDMAVDDMESILNECNASGIPGMRLRWHYRSRHESLIAFSNHHYYDNALHTFPSPVDRSSDMGVTFRHVADGVYDRGGSRTNRIEAEQVVNEVMRMLQNPAASHSIGIVTFNQAQQMLIEDLLDAQRRAQPEIERFFTNEVEEPVFVKNLENVQGDERDTIIFSVGYGCDGQGKMTMNFGPLNQEGGERRLNVAVTRARQRLMVFSSLRADEIDLRRTQALGVRHFKTFLDYADRGPAAIAEAVEYHGVREFESTFEKAVCDALVQRGFDIDTQVGCAGYRIDLAVRDPQRPGRYLLGIECDGATYHSAKTARDRDRLRQSVLEGLGWRIERIWSTEWRINAQRCIERVERAIERAKDSGAAPPPPETPDAATTNAAASPPPPVAPPPPDTPPAGTAPPAQAAVPPSSLHASTVSPHAPPPTLDLYTLARPPRSVARIDIDDNRAEGRLIDALQRIVDAEGPIVEELALRRLADWLEARVTERFRSRFDALRDAAVRSGAIRRADDALWPIQLDPQRYTSVRWPGDDDAARRDLDLIPRIERVNGVLHVLHMQFGLPEEDLQREFAKLFGHARVTQRIAEVAAEAIDAAVATGRARRDNGRVTLAV